ncbi:WD40-repeat-containing domain protein [Aspergillus pseudocaelatus]|uniref:WD40-repeat-containing domain protein n=1 Tax=Aspergillus pseudocaelatus TaxID=1825620 RepID=A0ABQ6W5C3_9EURO|nr:WD40-repeat-containing domain protein [Aspergillus pseudocaelatus]
MSMNGRKLVQNFTYGLEHDFVSPTGEPAAWAQGHPKRWGQERAKIRLGGNASTLTLSPDDRLVAVGVHGEIRVFDVALQAPLEVLTDEERAEIVQFAPGVVDSRDGKHARYLLASQGGDNENPRVILWELDDPDGKTMVFFSQNETTQEESREAATLPCVNLWNVETRSFRHHLLGHTDRIMWAAMSPDNRLVASAAWDGTARLWSGAFSSDQKFLAVSQGNPRTYIHVYDIATGQPVSRFDRLHMATRSLSWKLDGTMLACGADDGTLCIWDPYTGEEQMRCLLIVGRKLVFQIREGTVEVYDFESNLKQQFTRGVEDKMDRCPVSEMVCSGDSKFIVVPDMDGSLRIWDL